MQRPILFVIALAVGVALLGGLPGAQASPQPKTVRRVIASARDSGRPLDVNDIVVKSHHWTAGNYGVHVRWTPDGKHLVFGSQPLKIADSRCEHVRETAQGFYVGMISPDSAFVYGSRGRPIPGLFAIRIADGELQRIAGQPANDAAFSPDGKHVAASYQPVVFDREVGRPIGEDWAVMRTDGTGLAPLAKGRGTAPSWSADGRRLAQVIGGTLYVVDADGSNSHALAEVPPGSHYGWTGSGQILVHDQGSKQVIVVDTTTGQKRVALTRIIHTLLECNTVCPLPLLVAQDCILCNLAG